MHLKANKLIKPALFCLGLLLFKTAAATNLVLENDGSVKVQLQATAEELELLQFSKDLVNWDTIARDYGNGWELSTPHQWPIETVGTTTTLEELNSAEKGFYRRIVESTAPVLSNAALASRFLSQTTFGPTNDSINNFPGQSDPNFNQAPYTFFEQWINTQIALPEFYHRAFFRQRSNPYFIDASTTAGRLPNEVGHDTALDHRLTFYIGNTAYRTNWTCPLPGYGGLFDANGVPIDPADHAGNLDSNGVPKIGKHVDNAIAHGLPIWDLNYSSNDTKRYIWYHSALTADDQLRQRIAWALNQFFVVGETGSNHPAPAERWVNYYDIFVRHAFGNFRDILTDITWSPHMAYYLSYLNNKKADPTEGTFPDENYAREVMQLFTIGLWELNLDGSLKKDSAGNAIPTYDNDDIEEFARVFTGLRLQADRTNIEIFNSNYIDPLRTKTSWHDFGSKTLLDGSQLGPFNENSAGITSDIEGLLDHLFAHPNTAPFFARFIIQRLTVSNPSSNYIEAVASAFESGLYNNQGTGQRGDLVAVIKATLLHPEARESALQFDPAHGKLREPLIRLMHLSRALQLNPLRTYGWYSFNKLNDIILQEPYGAPSVFNFYRPDFSPNGDIDAQGLNAPEFQIHNDISALQLKNAFYTLTHDGIAGYNGGNIGSKWYAEAVPVYTNLALAGNISALLDELNLVLAAGRLDSATLTIIEDSLNNLGLSGVALIKKAYYLVSLSPHFNIQF
jgi:uncharacterized protein (DUF1800 family)